MKKKLCLLMAVCFVALTALTGCATTDDMANDANPTTTAMPTTAPSTTAPSTTAPSTSAPSTTTPSTTTVPTP